MIIFRPQIHPSVGQPYGVAQLFLNFSRLSLFLDLLMKLLYLFKKQAIVELLDWPYPCNLNVRP